MAKASRSQSSRGKQFDKKELLADYRLGWASRHASLIGRKEVLTGKAKFGIFGDGKEVAQLAMAKAWRPGDWRSGYYRDQTIMLAVGVCTLKQIFAQLYSDTDLSHDPMSGGRQMNAHFSTRYIDADGRWLSQTAQANTAADLSPTAAQMGRLVGLGYASKLYRQNPNLHGLKDFSINGNEVAFGTIGNASAAEGIFWEALNACGVLQVPVAVSVWDDGFGISVPNKYQMTKDSISAACAGFAADDNAEGYDIYVVKGWDYPALVDAYRHGIERVRDLHRPALYHITELTQPQGHSTSGSHERYKTAERLQFEQDADCLKRMREWLLSSDIVTESELKEAESLALADTEKARSEAWQEYLQPISNDRAELMAIYDRIAESCERHDLVDEAKKQLSKLPALLRRGIVGSARKTLFDLRLEKDEVKAPLRDFVHHQQSVNQDRYTRWLHSETARSPLNVKEVAAIYGDNPESIPGNEVIQRCFDTLFAREPRLFIIGEDVGKLGDVNQNFKGLQEKYGELRLTDTGIREATILGQGLGAAIRGLRPVVDIQYLDYLLYCFQLLSDDLATLHYRSAGGQIAPVIVRTKGHRLEGIWHSGSPMGVLTSGLRGMHVCVPRSMVQAAGMYNTLFQGDDPAIVIEVLSGYRLRETVPENLSEFTVPLGVPEIVVSGSDITVVTYGACVRIAEEAAERLATAGVSLEVIDVRTLLPFDRPQLIAQSIKKTNAVIFMDEDVPGGATAFMMQQVFEQHGAYHDLDAPPKTLTAPANRPAYASDADYWCKPSVEDLVEAAMTIMHERHPEVYQL
ncbi:MAG: hypothetical protein RL011_1699 [Pseudomonadota bacterium]